MSLAPEQVTQLLKPINPRRVLQANGMSHVSQQDVRAHLIRIFGFDGWDKEILELRCIRDTEVTVPGKNGKPDREGVPSVTYLCRLRLTVRDPQGNVVKVAEDVGTGTSPNLPSYGDAHDFAAKNAVSYALKRCATDLGDQFGLSLYNKGQLAPLVGGLILKGTQDVEKDVPQQVDLGEELPTDDGLMSAQEKRDHDALVREVQANPKRAQRQRGRQQEDIFAEPLTDEKWLESITARISECPSMNVWRGLAAEVKQEVDLGHVSAVDADLLDKRLTEREIQLSEVAS